MTDSAGLSDLLLRWQEGRERGQDRAPEEWCAGRPELVEEFRRRAAALASMERRLGIGVSAQEEEAAEMPVVPGYEILGLLGRGGMGVVYRARQRGLTRVVALKMLLDGPHATAAQRSRFRAEAEAVARLQHPNIVAIDDVGDADGRPFFTMELLDGGSLAEKLARGPLPVDEALTLLLSLAQAMEAAHRRGVVHRDLKPSNLLFASDGMPKVADFGLAKCLDGGTRHTRSGTVLGTPGSLAPEQADGQNHAVGPTADVWALGAILYETLTNRPPFRGETVLGTLLAVLSNEPPPLRRLRPQVPRDLESICLKCLAKRPERRYASAAALADDLQRHRRGQAIRARRAGVFKSRPRWIALGMALLASVAALAFLGMREDDAARRSRRAAVELAPRVRHILHKNCRECHGEDRAERGLHVLDYGQLIDPRRHLVVPGAADESRLFQRIRDESMPPPEAEELPRVSLEELQILEEWIAGGAPPFPESGSMSSAIAATELSAQVKEIFAAECYGCHRHTNARGGIKIMNYDLLVNQRKVVVPGKPDESELYRLLVGHQDPPMPPRPIPRLDARHVETVRRWIEDAAAPFPRTR